MVTISRNQGTCNSGKDKKIYKLISKPFKMEITRRIQLLISQAHTKPVHTLFKYK